MSPIVKTIRKRNGEIVPFEKEKITNAVKKAFFAVTAQTHANEANYITETIVQKMQEIVSHNDDDKVIGVEEIQDMVELAIMQMGYHSVAKAYIIYRFEHTKQRERKKEKVKEKIEENALCVKKANGRTEIFSREKIRKTLTRTSIGLEEIDIESVIGQVELEVHDNIGTKDVARSLVLVARSFIEKEPDYAHLASRLLLEGIIYKDTLGKISDRTDFAEHYKESFKKNLNRAVSLRLLDEELLSFDLDRIAKAIEPWRDDYLKYLGTQTLADRYLIRERKTNGKEIFLETPQFMWMRVSMGLSLNENDKEGAAINFYKIFSTLRFISSTPTLFHAGTPYPQLSSCYLGVTDDSLESIFGAYQDAALLSKHAGGIGWSWSKIRATGARVKTTNIDSNGVIPFLKIADSVTVAINRSGRRRGATCVYLETWHLDIMDFLELRKNTGDDRRRTHDINTANWIPDLFMKRVRNNEKWTLFSPDETPELHDTYGRRFEEIYEAYEEKAERGEMNLFKTIKARDLWKKMITQLFETGHPWMTWKDPSNIRSPQDHVGVIHSSNLCTEITLPTIPDEETAVCNLGSINLSRHITDRGLDENLLRESVMTAMHMLDNVIDINYYPTEAARKSNLRHRPVGLGLMGFQDALYKLGINFASEEAVSFADKSMEIISYYAILTSSILAKNRGAYETYEGSKWSKGLLPIDTLGLLEKERGEEIPVDRNELLDWKPVRESIKKYGMRNSNCLAIAPTATISNIAGSLPAIEPIYKNIYVKANISGEFIIVNHYLIDDLKKEGLWNEEMLELIKGQEGELDNISAIPRRIKDKYKEVFDISPEWLIKIAAHRAKWIDQSQSLNIFYKGSSGSELSRIYQYAWKMGLKTTYYLRTLAASAIEKSTVSLERQNVQSSVSKKTDDTAPLVEAMVQRIREEVKSEAEASRPKNKKNYKSTSSPAPAAVFSGSANLPAETASGEKLCKMEDPECEACQ
ncbi:ribonucleoside-diphosphate reductase subunit alpha [Candidatus Campbellbacteria bacterium CG11_big_fil_rev_8_21_14_0_20_44_21]|nr:MAG: ribonucleoside-diphosphate reductase subunit alpha [Candidatus Campbellbacteria bacterium CG11_big_fil_rev_8_21_14_0_20_44_21]